MNLEIFAYVKPNDITHVVYLGAAFFNASSIMGLDSQPGILIHEISHFIDVLCLKDFNKKGLL